MKYNILELYVVPKDGNNFICTYNRITEVFTEVLTNTKIRKNEVFMISRLRDYCSLLELGVYEKGKLVKPMMLDKKAILDKYISLNQKKNDFNVSEFLKHQEKEIEDLKNLKESNPELAKIVAIEKLEKTGVLDDKGELNPPYDKVFVKKKDK